MKKPLLKTALTLAVTGTVFSGSVLSTQAYASDQSTDNTAETTIASENQYTGSNYVEPGIGIGAATGTLLAGPVGLLAGGVIGAFIGSSIQKDNNNHIVESSNTATAGDSSENSIAADTIIDNPHNQLDAEINSQAAGVMIAQAGPSSPWLNSPNEKENEDLLNHLTGDISLDVFFRSGSTAVEPFYSDRLIAVANLLNATQQLELHLDGYTDRRGDKLQNIELARARIESVRKRLIDAGVDKNRIISKAHGEMKMVSVAGDLEAYNFDRKVVIRFELGAEDLAHELTQTPNNSPNMESVVTGKSTDSTDDLTDQEESTPVVASATAES